VKYASDITKRVEEKQEFNLLSLVADGADDSVVTDRDRRIIYVNEGFRRLTGYTDAAATGKSPGRILQGVATDPDTIARIRSKLANGEAFYDEILKYKSMASPIGFRWQSIRSAMRRGKSRISFRFRPTSPKPRCSLCSST
jgi:methyl-accepting chemotaxis protein